MVYVIFQIHISELAKGSCLTEYRWNSGGTFKGKEWNNELPSDAVVSILCFIFRFIFKLYCFI